MDGEEMIAEQLAEILKAKELIKGFRKDTFENDTPDDLDECLGIFVEGGGAQILNIPENELLVTLIIRKPIYSAARDFSLELFRFFNRNGFILPNGRRLVVHPSAPPKYLNTDMRERAEFTYTFICTVNIM